METPADAAPVAPAAYYLGPSDDGTRPGVFMVNTYKHNTRYYHVRKPFIQNLRIYKLFSLWNKWICVQQ